ncbi:MAG: chemotaxis protein CheA [Proteobacteria bacterium]|nr:chemotaxis protein CheA [Pseudomonadota bacterium]
MAARRSRSVKSKAHREFVSEAEELLDRMSGDLSDLHDQRAVGEIDPDLVNRIFRSAHSLKGLAGMFGLDGIGELAHHLEDVLDGLRLGRVAADAPAVGLLDEAVALFGKLLQRLGDEGKAEEDSLAVADLVTRIAEAIEETAAVQDELVDLDVDPALMRALTEYEEHRLRENLRRGRHISLINTMFEIITFEEGLAELSAAVREVGEVVSTLPSPGETPESQIRFSLLVATEVDAEQLAARLEFADTSIRAVREASNRAASIEMASAPAPELATGLGESADIESLKSISDTVRVDIRKLDELMNLVGELVIQRGSLSRIADRLCRDPETSRVGGELAKVHKVIERKLKDLQNSVLDVRMVPLRHVFEKISRVVRRLRRDLGKDVSLEYKGADTELDKLIVEELIDPLMHVVRNAFDHAIESEEERVMAGKPAQGRILIEASQRGNHVVIEVADDGRGIDPAEVRRRAEAAGLVAPDAVLTPKETLDLVFLPGLSTRDEVTETSGRGVGMDVVRANLTALDGIVDIDSVLGKGTTVVMTLPLTLAIIQALIVTVGDQRYAIPLNSVLETLLLQPEEVQRSEGREMMNLRGEPLPLRRLADEFNLRSTSEDEKRHVVVLGLGELRLGLLVDSLEGQQDTIMKSIQGPIQQVRGIAGATEIGDQGAVLVIDVSSIVEDAMRRRDAA